MLITKNNSKDRSRKYHRAVSDLSFCWAHESRDEKHLPMAEHEMMGNRFYCQLDIHRHRDIHKLTDRNRETNRQTDRQKNTD